MVVGSGVREKWGPIMTWTEWARWALTRTHELCSDAVVKVGV